jgi:hypothetical protein
MALTKHQKLARGLKALLDVLDEHYQKVAAALNVLQLHFIETHHVPGRPPMTKEVFKTMTKTYACGLQRFSLDDEVQSAAHSVPTMGIAIHQRLYPRSHILLYPPDTPPNAKIITLWQVKKILVPSKILQQLHEDQLAAILYCASKEEISETIGWFEPEDKADSLANQWLAISNFYHEKDSLETNLKQLAYSHYRTAVLKYYEKIKFPKMIQKFAKFDFSPKEQTAVFQAYQQVTESIRKRNKRHFDDFLKVWRQRLEELIFSNLNWPENRRKAILAEYFPSKMPVISSTNGRWKTGQSLDRQTYASYIHNFAQIFIENPLKNKADGEIVLLLWLMIYIAREFEKIYPITRLLELSTANISEECLVIDGQKIQLSCGLADLLMEYAGDGNLQHHQKLFPNLTDEKLEEHFRQASTILLPSGSLPALPEAFLTFPHPYKGCRMNARNLRFQQQHPVPVKEDVISRKEIKRQLGENHS